MNCAFIKPQGKGVTITGEYLDLMSNFRILMTNSRFEHTQGEAAIVVENLTKNKDYSIKPSTQLKYSEEKLKQNVNPIKFTNCEIVNSKKLGIMFNNVHSSSKFKKIHLKENKESGLLVKFSQDMNNLNPPDLNELACCCMLRFEDKLNDVSSRARTVTEGEA